ncbi:MAG: hypothetical protein AAF415_07095 [Pseudomonadota bacterium]
MPEESHLEKALAIMTSPSGSQIQRQLAREGIRLIRSAIKSTRGRSIMYEIAEWIYHGGINGLGIGERMAAGSRVRGDLVVKVYVEKKLPKRKLDFVVPEKIEFEGLPTIRTDVEQIGKVELHSNIARVRPAPPGFSIGLADEAQVAGTFGLVVRKKGTEGPLYLLSNSHAIAASGFAKKGSKIVQPGAYDGGKAPNDTIAALSEWIPFQFTDKSFPNTVDCAIAELEDGAATAAIAELGVPKGVNLDLKRGMEIRKMGRTTTFSVALVKDIHLRVPSTYPDGNGKLGRVGFSDVVLTSFYTSGGDSGSGVLDTGNNVVGLHMAGSPVVGIFCKIGNVMDALGIEVVTQQMTGT